ncbi:ATP-dependent DNA helicase [Acetobacteraceae bacterium]|nr:ATP-dependent DNA helicase [Acetobacteraceae bacterium]
MAPPPLLVHGVSCCETLGITIPSPPRPWLDLLDLFLFVKPATSLPSPTPEGLAQALNLPFRNTPDFLYDIAHALLSEVKLLKEDSKGVFLRQLLAFMKYGNWQWEAVLKEYLGEISSDEKKKMWQKLQIWNDLPEWEDSPAPAPSKRIPLSEDESRTSLLKLLRENEVRRPAQENFSEKIAEIFSLPKKEASPFLLLAEAETGTGKTLGYLAPSHLWAEKNEGCVWISTYTKHLQRQVESELSRFYPDKASRNQNIVVLKGRENYLCLLKLQEIILPLFLRVQSNPNTQLPSAVPFALLLNWIKSTNEGDMKGGDLAGWFSHLYGFSYLYQLTDREGECLHSGCLFYQRCFYEHINRKALYAKLVISNHALTLIRLAQAAENENIQQLPAQHFIFDESHHLQMAADNVFALELSLKALSDFRDRLLGSPSHSKRRKFKSLHHYLKPLFSEFSELETSLSEIETKARKILPSAATLNKFFISESEENKEEYCSLEFFKAISDQLDAYEPTDAETGTFERETNFYPSMEEVMAISKEFLKSLEKFLEKFTKFYKFLSHLPLQEETEESETRTAVEITCNRLKYYLLPALQAWVSMLKPLPEIEAQAGGRIRIIRGDWESSDDFHKRWKNVRLCENWIDPTLPLSALLKNQALGVAYVSGTFRPYKPILIENEVEISWQPAKRRTGSLHINGMTDYDFQKSPFNYKKQAKVFVITDVGYSIRELADAYQKLFITAQGGALGLFTAIARLQKVYHYIAPHLSKAGIDLYAQHVSGADNTQLVDVFRQNEQSCLLGTDAMRDGIDIPGRSLQLVVMEKVPWPRSDILHRERKKQVYIHEKIKLEEEEAALRLRQAFGRLIRNSEDKGVFVLLDRRTPSRLLKALPEEIEVEKIPLQEALEKIKIFLETI